MPVDYDALAAQHGGTAVVDYDKLAAQHGGNGEPEGFWHSLGSQLGVTPEIAKQKVDEFRAHPITQLLESASGAKPLQMLYDMARGPADQLKQAYQAGKEGNAAGVAQHAITAIPIVGPAMDKLTDQQPIPKPGQSYLSQVGDTLTNPGSLGTLIGATAQAAPLALGAADAAGVKRPNTSLPSLPNLMDKFPTQGKAGELFQHLNSELAEHPVTLSSTAAPLQRAIEIAARGGTMPAPVKALLERSQAIEPMTFPEARDYQASLSDLSASDKLAMNGRMKGAVAQLNHALYQDIRQAAESGAGMGADYDKAMTEYRQASQIKNAVKATGSVVGKAAATGALGTAGYSLLRQIQESR